MTTSSMWALLAAMWVAIYAIKEDTNYVLASLLCVILMKISEKKSRRKRV